MIAVPCWSSWNTGIFMRSRSFASTSKHSGALMSSRLMPPNVGSSAATTSISWSRIVRGDLDVEHVDAGEFLEQDRLAFHHRLAGERADVAEPEHRGAVGDHRDEVGARGQFGGLRRIGGDRLAGGGDAGRIGERQVALVAERLGRLDFEFSGPRQPVIDQRARAQVVGQIRRHNFLRCLGSQNRSLPHSIARNAEVRAAQSALTASQTANRGRNGRETASRNRPCAR